MPARDLPSGPAGLARAWPEEHPLVEAHGLAKNVPLVRASLPVKSAQARPVCAVALLRVSVPAVLCPAGDLAPAAGPDDASAPPSVARKSWSPRWESSPRWAQALISLPPESRCLLHSKRQAIRAVVEAGGFRRVRSRLAASRSPEPWSSNRPGEIAPLRSDTIVPRQLDSPRFRDTAPVRTLPSHRVSWKKAQ